MYELLQLQRFLEWGHPMLHLTNSGLQPAKSADKIIYEEKQA